MFESRHHSEFFDLRIEMDLCFRGRDVADRLEQAVVVEPVDPFEGGKLDRFETAPRSAPYDDFGFEEADDYFCQRVEAPIFVNEPDVLFLACRFG